MRSRRSFLITAVLWSLIAIVWCAITVSRYNDPNTIGDSLVLTIFTMLLSAALAVFNWIRYARYNKK